MGIIRKIIALFFLVILFFVIVQSKTLLTRISNWMIGPEKTPFQIGSSYIEEIYKLPSYTGDGDGTYQSRFASLNPGYPRTMRAATVSKTGSTVSLIVEGVAVPVAMPLAFWLANTPDVTNKTKYVNFGKIVEPYTFREYPTSIGNTSVDLAVYRYLMLVNTQTYQPYSVWTLQ